MDIKTLEGKYFGPFEIKKAILSERKTFLGKEKVELSLDNKKTEVLPLEIALTVITKEKSDLTNLRENWVAPVAEQILVLLVEAEVPQRDIDYLLGVKITESLNVNSKKAIGMLFGKPKAELNLMDIEEVLRGEVVSKRVKPKKDGRRKKIKNG